MKQLGKHFPNEVVRVDVYGGGTEVYFSEFTYTTAGCGRKFQPMVVDGLLYGLMKGEIDAGMVTPEYIEDMLSDESWVMLSLKDDDGRDDGNGSNRTMVSSTSHPSPVDLCMKFEEYGERKKRKEELFEKCIRHLRKVRKYPLRCIVSEKNGTKVHSFGVGGPTMEGASNEDACVTKLAGMNGKAYSTLDALS